MQFSPQSNYVFEGRVVVQFETLIPKVFSESQLVPHLLPDSCGSNFELYQYHRLHFFSEEFLHLCSSKRTRVHSELIYTAIPANTPTHFAGVFVAT